MGTGSVVLTVVILIVLIIAATSVALGWRRILVHLLRAATVLRAAAVVRTHIIIDLCFVLASGPCVFRVS